MLGFYENLLGRDEKKPMPRAGALAEAKRWLRGPPLEEAEGLADALWCGASGWAPLAARWWSLCRRWSSRPSCLPATGRSRTPDWAAFVLVGDPD